MTLKNIIRQESFTDGYWKETWYLTQELNAFIVWWTDHTTAPRHFYLSTSSQEATKYFETQVSDAKKEIDERNGTAQSVPEIGQGK